MDSNSAGRTQVCVNKLIFETKEEAQASALVAELHHGIRLKAYQCKHCQLWHLSSK